MLMMILFATNLAAWLCILAKKRKIAFVLLFLALVYAAILFKSHATMELNINV